jgi:hypothetical protein
MFSPVRMDMSLTASVAGDVLTLNGTAFDFGGVPKGGVLDRDRIDCDWIAGDVTRDDDGVIHVALIVPHGADAPQQTLFPKPVEVGSGKVPIPRFDRVAKAGDNAKA